MNPSPTLTESTIRQLASAQSFERGQDYYASGAVLELAQRGDQLLAEVEGSSYEPYQVSATLDKGGIVDADCTCPYDWGGYCKHIVAVLLAYVHEPEQIEERPAVESLLADLDRGQLQDLLLTLVERQPGLADVVESQITPPSPTGVSPVGGTAARQAAHGPGVGAALDPAPFRRQVQAALHSLDRMRPSEAYWHVGEVIRDLGQVLDQARTFIESGDGDSALVILQALTEEYLADWTVLDGSSGETGEFWSELALPWAEALLSADLTPAEREAWADRLTGWQAEVSDYGIDDVFDAAQAAALQGWEYPPLTRVLEEGEITGKGAREGEAPWFADDLAVARLNVLARQGRTQEYLDLAEAEGQTERYATMLAQLGRIQEAVDYGLKHLATSEEALALAKALREQGELESAWQIGEHGLTLEGHAGAALARWLRDLAGGAGWSKRALNAAEIAFCENPALAEYQAAQALARKRWPQVKKRLLELLATVSYAPAKIDVYLHEGMVAEAVKAADESDYLGYDALAQVAEAATESHPDWVISQCQSQAARIMDAGKSKYYHHAVNWLARARAAYLAAGREAEWRTYLEALLKNHSRKYSLVPKLKKLR